MFLNLSMIALCALWIYSVYSIARWRGRVLSEKEQFSGILNDSLFNVYLTVSGSGVLLFLAFLLT